MTAIAPTKAWVFTGIIALCALPLLLAHHIPLIDYPWHLARMHILHHHTSDEFLQEAYEISFAPLPNLAMDVLVALLSQAVSVEYASRLFVLLTMVVTVSGVGFLYRTLYGTWSNLNVLLGAVLFYNWIFVYGFVNYLFGIAILLWSVAIWLLLIEHTFYKRLAVGIFLSFALFFAHLVAFVLFAVVLGGIALHRSISDWSIDARKFFKESFITFSILSLPTVIYVFHSPSSKDIEGGFIFQHWSLKLEGLALTPLTFTPIGDAAIGGALLLLTAFAVLRGRIFVASSMVIILAFVALVFIFAPVGSQAGWYLDDRIPLVILLLLAAGISIHLPPTVSSRIVILVLVFAVFLRSVLITVDWIAWDQVYDQSRQAFSKLEAPAILFVATRQHWESRRNVSAHYRWIRPPFHHIGAYAALERGVFVPMVYAHPHLQPIRIAADAKRLSEVQLHDPIFVQSPAELTELIEQLGSLTADLPSFIEHVYLYVRDDGLWGMDFDVEVVTVVREEDFMMLRLR